MSTSVLSTRDMLYLVLVLALHLPPSLVFRNGLRRFFFRMMFPDLWFYSPSSVIYLLLLNKQSKLISCHVYNFMHARIQMVFRILLSFLAIWQVEGETVSSSWYGFWVLLFCWQELIFCFFFPLSICWGMGFRVILGTGIQSPIYCFNLKLCKNLNISSRFFVCALKKDLLSSLFLQQDFW